MIATAVHTTDCEYITCVLLALLCVLSAMWKKYVNVLVVSTLARVVGKQYLAYAVILADSLIRPTLLHTITCSFWLFAATHYLQQACIDSVHPL
jgi:hypothetical protein